MNNTAILIWIVVIISVVGGIVLSSSASKGIGTISGQAIAGQQEVQKVTLSLKDYNYYPNTIKVKAGQPVSITLDKSISGCFRSFTIKELGVFKNSKTPEDTIDFLPEKKGTYRFACSMGMGFGTLIVE